MPVLTPRPVIKLGSQGDAVAELQTLLNQRLGGQLIFKNVVPVAIDGDFGDRTRRAVVAYQEHYALLPDGVVGDRTWTSLLQTRFPDITGHWAANYITVLANMGIVRGDDTGNYLTNATVTRGQFARLLNAAFDRVLTVKRPAVNFADVSAGDRATVTRIYQAGIMSGFDDGTFRPEVGIRRQDVLVALVLILGTRRDGGTNILTAYDDANTISDYAKTPVIIATLHDIVVNHPRVRLLNPKAVTTRGELAAFLERSIVQYVKRQKLFGVAVDLGYPVPQEPVNSPFVVPIPNSI
jgi:hypothetical protein